MYMWCDLSVHIFHNALLVLSAKVFCFMGAKISIIKHIAEPYNMIFFCTCRSDDHLLSCKKPAVYAADFSFQTVAFSVFPTRRKFIHLPEKYLYAKNTILITQSMYMAILVPTTP